MTETRFVLIRHAQSTWNANKRWQGQADPPLSAHGCAQAEQLAKQLASQPIDALFASDLHRAARTAEILGDALGMVPVVDVRLRELDVGNWAGLTRDEILRRDPEALARFEAGDPDVCAGGGESRRAIRLRVASCVRQRIREHSGRSIALVAHLDVIRALRPDWELANAEWRCSAASALCVAEPAGARP